MNTVKTIQQYSTTYIINQLGNRSFRIAYKVDGEARYHHVDKVWDTVEDAEEYISTCNSMDAMLEMGNPKYASQQRYDAANTTQVKLKLNTTTDADILAHLAAQGNKQGYIKALIRKDMQSKTRQE